MTNLGKNSSLAEDSADLGGVKEEDLELIFQLIDERNSKKLDIKAKTVAEREEWVADIKKVMEDMSTYTLLAPFSLIHFSVF